MSQLMFKTSPAAGGGVDFEVQGKQVFRWYFYTIPLLIAFAFYTRFMNNPHNPDDNGLIYAFIILVGVIAGGIFGFLALKESLQIGRANKGRGRSHFIVSTEGINIPAQDLMIPREKILGVNAIGFEVAKTTTTTGYVPKVGVAFAQSHTAGLSPLVAAVSNQVIVSIRGERDRVLAGGLDEESAIKLAGEVLEALDD